MNYFFIFLAIIFIIYIYNSIKKNEFSIEESVFWIIGCIFIIILSIFYKKLDSVAIFLGISYAPSMVFLLSTMFLLIMNFRNSKKILKLNNRIVELAQKVSILEYELKEKKNEKK